MLVLAELLQVMVAGEDIVDVLDLEGQVVEPGPAVGEAEEDVVVDILLAAVAAVERADEVVLAADIEVVGADEAQRVAEPLHGLAQLGRRHDAVADALHRGGPPLQPVELALAAQHLGAVVDRLAADRNRRDPVAAVHPLDLVAVWLPDPYARAAAALVD